MPNLWPACALVDAELAPQEVKKPNQQTAAFLQVEQRCAFTGMKAVQRKNLTQRFHAEFLFQCYSTA